jgi:DNA-binding PadR family transcriptional regulator
MSKFKGFESSKQNWSKLPHQLIEALPNIKTIGEMKVIIYTLRHTWGYQDDYKKITLDEFENGRKRKDGSRIDNGTGLTKPTIVDGIKRAVADGFLFEHIDTSDSARVEKFYSLTQEGLKDLTSGVKTFNTRGKETLHRTEKETIKKETLENSSAKNSQNQNLIKPGDSLEIRLKKTQKTSADLLKSLKEEKHENSQKPFGIGLNPNEDQRKNNLNALADQIAKTCDNINIATAHPDTITELKRVTLALYKENTTISDLKDFEIWWYDKPWQGEKKQAPTLKLLGDKWGQFKAQKVISVPEIDTSKGFYV